ncbi:MAG: SGNH/GDSL hydrolase family protein [Bacteroidia bacterium]|nr:SGNH/GDSL hydrolase family protein [Bacteroidia bacterium]
MSRIYLKYFLEKSPNPKFQFDSFRIYSHRPNFKEGDGKRDWIIIHSQGFRRSTDVEIKKPANCFRAFLLGGSAAHGISSAPPYPVRHVYNDETIDAYLEKMLQKKYPNKKIEIINAAVTGYQVFQHTNYIISELLEYSPDLMIFFDGVNDHYTWNPDFKYMADNRYQFWKSRLQNPSFVGLCDYFGFFLSSYSAFGKLYCSWRLEKDAVQNTGRTDFVRAVFKNKEELIEKHQLAAPKQFLKSIDINLLLLQHYKIKSIVCYQPLFCQRDTSLLSNQERDIKQFNLGNEPKIILYPVIKRELEDLTAIYKAPFIDMFPFYNDSAYKGKQLFIDYVHFSAMGSQVAANVLFPEVDKIISSIQEENN